MRLRITRNSEGTTTVLHVDGELLGEGVRELERLAGTTYRLRIDLTHLRRADAKGLAVLRRLAAAGAELANASPFIALLLERPAKPL